MQYKESEILELKSSFGEWKEIIISLVAFANKKGGKVIVGLNDIGQPANLVIGKNTIEDFVNKLKNSTDPILYPSINVKSFALGEIVEITIPESDLKPVFAFEKAFVRIGKTNSKLSANELRELIKRYTIPDFDGQIYKKEFNEKDFDIELINTVKEDYYHLKNLNTIEFFKKINLIRNNELTNTAYLCFTKKNYDFPNAIVKAARFKGNDMARFIDMKDFDGNLIEMPDKILSFIKRQINMEVVIEDKAQRVEKWTYSIEALREAIINAIVHRDYSDSGNINIRIFDDRLEIWSPGLLPKEININKILQENRSIIRNKHLAQVFFSIKMIENWGTGFHKIFYLNRENGNIDVNLSEKTGAFVITFYKKINDEINGGVNGGVNKLYEIIKTNPNKRTKELAKLMNTPQKTVEKWIAKLKKTNKIEFKGSSKTGGYFVIP